LYCATSASEARSVRARLGQLVLRHAHLGLGARDAAWASTSSASARRSAAVVPSGVQARHDVTLLDHRALLHVELDDAPGRVGRERAARVRATM
jgi:hypothetical protein